jgi:hypothetical protein
MTPKLPASSHKCCDTRPPAAVPKRPSGRSRSPRIDRSTITSPATRPWTQISPGARGTTAPTASANPHNHSPPPLTTAPVQISSTPDARYCKSSEASSDPRPAGRVLERAARAARPAAARQAGFILACAGGPADPKGRIGGPSDTALATLPRRSGARARVARRWRAWRASGLAPLARRSGPSAALRPGGREIDAAGPRCERVVHVRGAPTHLQARPPLLLERSRQRARPRHMAV